MEIIVNGAGMNVDEGLSIGSLLVRLGKSAEHVAVEHNGELVASSAFATLKLKPEDRLEVVHFVGGG
jgi:sulfur carrier protein